MATENRILDVSYEADEDLSADQYHFVVIDPTSGKVRRPNSATEYAIGVLQNAPEAGEAAVMRVAGISKVVANAALAINLIVKPEYVGAADAGKANDATAATAYARGMVVEASGAEDDLASILLIGPNPA